MNSFEIAVKVRMQVDAPTIEEAERYGVIFVEDAIDWLLKEGCNPGDGFDDETGIAFEDVSLRPMVAVNLTS